MITVIVQHVAEDYDTWRPIFDEHGTTRQAHGCESERVYRAVDDPNAVAVVMEWPSKEAAEGFMADPSLAEAMQRGGIVAPPTITFGDRVPQPAH
ncbi:MAG: antibiotic biosynthesis monooxygenase [Actinobacteria bacterium]|nr:antibiotic biosynthesis monooxygenase [Actinomycetota bacterium]